MKSNDFIVVSPQDNVAVALKGLSKGEKVLVDGKEITLLNDIPFGHKFSLTDISVDTNIIKYAAPISHAVENIKIGSHVHTHNTKTNLSDVIDYEYNPLKNLFSFSDDNVFFMGYNRADGQTGIRNEIWIIPTVGCVNQTAQTLASKMNLNLPDGVDGVYAFPHNMGCSQLTDDHERTQKILAGLVNHPNAAGVLVLSLGCENNNLDEFKPMLGDYNDERVRFLVTQDVSDEINEGEKIIKELMDYALTFKRKETPISELTIGFKCGGSDAFSGITANPLCGKISDKIVSLGGSAILTEVPEMFGAETFLMNRAASKTVFDKTVELINSFKNYFKKYNQTIYENPSPGNKEGGITTLEEKSLGCIQKSGTSKVVDDLDWAQPVRIKGLNLLTGPGNDQVSCTNLVASGAQIVIFTTGRGNPFGSPVPTLKLASNSVLSANKPHWIDYDAGEIITGKSFDTAADELFQLLIKIANGQTKAKNEISNNREISIFRDGVIL